MDRKYGLKITHLSTQRTMEFWFNDLEEREQGKKMFNPLFHEIEYISTEQEN